MQTHTRTVSITLPDGSEARVRYEWEIEESLLGARICTFWLDVSDGIPAGMTADEVEELCSEDLDAYLAHEPDPDDLNDARKEQYYD